MLPIARWRGARRIPMSRRPGMGAGALFSRISELAGVRRPQSGTNRRVV
ncbi:MAG: hypothetical protein OJF60_000393 [Burkholderiaceae bacterium]|nr:MAG: hypothetical protein OJF60_000393 [Burkholderiaceae bacterium]